MKSLRYLFILCIGFIIGIFITFIFISYENFIEPDPWVIVHVKNQSSHKIKEIVIENENGTVKYYGLDKKSECKIPISLSGAGTYTIYYTLENHTKCKNFHAYVERGYETTEWITDEGTKNDDFNNKLNKCISN